MLDLSDLQRSRSQLALTDLTQASVSLWARLDNDIVAPFIFNIDVGTDHGWRVVTLTGATGLVLRVLVNKPTFAEWRSVTEFNKTDIHHLCFAWDGAFTAAGMRMWLDGVESTVTLTSAGSGSRVFGVPELMELGSTTAAETGDMGWLGIWNRPLAAAEAIQLSHKRSPLHFPDGLVSYWRLDNEHYSHDLVGNVDLFQHLGTGPQFWVPSNIDIVDPVGFQVIPGAAATNLPDADTVFSRRQQIASRWSP